VPANSVSFQWEASAQRLRYRTSISLHSHTLHSRENLGFLPKVLHPVPVVGYVLQKLEGQYRRKTGRELEYRRGYWTPPLPAHDAFRLERDQIETALGVPGLVSITDHDDLEACQLLQLVDEGCKMPFSVEWTAPFREAAFHIGVHNLPAESATFWLREMQAYTQRPALPRFREVITALHEIPQVLIVLNHPLSDEGRVGNMMHRDSLEEFLRDYRAVIHALELNGMHPWRHNRQVISIAANIGLPVISGGDRHGCEPNAVLNLTDATTWEEFIAEVRAGHSHVLFMPQYRESLVLRYIENIWHIVRDHPNLPDRLHWSDRVFWDHHTKGLGPLSAYLTETPAAIAGVINTIEWLMNPRVQSALSVLARREEIAL
jgi:hypothetical protein